MKGNHIFATDKDSKILFVRLKAVMHPLLAVLDALPLTFFGKGKTAYLMIDRAIEWCEKERIAAMAEKRQDAIGRLESILSTLRKARSDFENGNMAID